MRKTISTLIACAAIAVSGQANAAGDQIQIVGSSTVYPFVTAVAEEFGNNSDFKTPIVESTGTGGGFKLFCAGAGDEHPDVAAALNNLALFYHALERFDDTEPLYKKALIIWERVLGREHVLVAYSLNNLGKLYHTQGRYSEAEPLLEQSLVIRNQLFDDDHPDVVIGIKALAELYEAQKRDKEAQALRCRLSS